jgi:hypothetical protein
MIPTRNSNTIVIQSFRKNIIPSWIQRCLDSVQQWARSKGHDYSLAGDEFYDLCGPEYLNRGSKNPQAITNLARLVATRQRLDAGYQRVIWMDADVFVFDPANLVLDFSAESLTTGYAFGREVWLFRDATGVIRVTPPMAHNAATFFTRGALDLDVLISLIRHIDARRQLVSNYQVGVNLLRGLQYSLMFPTFSHVGMFSPILLHALAERDEKILQFYGRANRYQACAANLCLSKQDQVTEDVIWRAMDHLGAGAGDAINRYAADTGAHLVPYNCETSIGEQSATFNMWSYRLKVTLRSLRAILGSLTARHSSPTEIKSE